MKIALQKSTFDRTDLFKEAGFEVKQASAKNHDEMVDLLKDADGAQVGTYPLTSREVLKACPKLKVLSRMGVGVDSIDHDAATEMGILVCNVPGVNASEVADHAMALLLALTRKIVESVNSTRKGLWSENPKLTHEYRIGVERIAGHTVGILGFGNIGRAFATRIRGFAPANILAYDPYVPQFVADLYGVRMVEFQELLAKVDYLSIHCSSTAETRHLINSDSLMMMKKTVMIVNTARGPVIDETALTDALKNERVRAAALDVTEIEPVDSNNPLLGLPNCMVTPHTAGFSPTFLHECPIRQAENIIRVLNGQAPHSLTNPEVIKTIAVMRSSDPGRWNNIPDFSTALAL